MKKKSFEELMERAQGDEELFTPEFLKVVEAIEDWKDSQEEKGYEVSFVAAFDSFNYKNSHLQDCGIRTYGDKEMGKLKAEYLMKKLTTKLKGEDK